MIRNATPLLSLALIAMLCLSATHSRAQTPPQTNLVVPTEIPPGPPISSYVNELGITVSDYGGGVIIRTDPNGNILPSPEQCIAGKESNSKFGICNDIGFCGPNQMGVSSYMSTGMCQMMPPSQVMVQTNPGCTQPGCAVMAPCTQNSYHDCNLQRNASLGLGENIQHWEDCIWTPAAIAAAQNDGITLLQPNQLNPQPGQVFDPPLRPGESALARLNMMQLQSSNSVQQMGMDVYFDRARTSAQQIYDASIAMPLSFGMPVRINGIPMTQEVIMYLVNAAGKGEYNPNAVNAFGIPQCGASHDNTGAYAYVMTRGICAARDSHFDYDLHDTARKMFNCLMGLGTC